MPEELRKHRVTLTVAAMGQSPRAATDSSVELPYGTALADVKAAVIAAHPGVRVIEISSEHLRRLCRWLGSRERNAEFNRVLRFVTTESSRYCPHEDMGGYGSPGFDWQNPFTAYNVRLLVIAPS